MHNRREFDFLCGLEARLIPYYTPPACPGGHDFLHVRSMIQLGGVIKASMERFERKTFDLFDFDVACWLHNIDRPKIFKERIELLNTKEGEETEVRSTCNRFLGGAIFEGEIYSYEPGPKNTRYLNLIDAVIQHSKRDDDLKNDSPLLTALRIADKVVRLGPDGIVAAAAFRGSDILAYDSINPFGYSSTVEGKLKSIYNDFMRVLEWYGMLPYDWARDLVSISNRRAYIEFIRSFGKIIAERCGVENKVEEDIEKALGKYYHVIGFVRNF